MSSRTSPAQAALIPADQDELEARPRPGYAAGPSPDDASRVAAQAVGAARGIQATAR